MPVVNDNVLNMESINGTNKDSKTSSTENQELINGIRWDQVFHSKGLRILVNVVEMSGCYSCSYASSKGDEQAFEDNETPNKC